MPYKDPEANRAYWREYRKKNRAHLVEDQRVRRLARRYGLTAERYQELLDMQGGVCYFCKEPPGKYALSVDHDHRCCKTWDNRDDKTPACGKCVRGLLCHLCNTALGRLGDTPEKLQEVLNYLNLPPAQTSGT